MWNTSGMRVVRMKKKWHIDSNIKNFLSKFSFPFDSKHTSKGIENPIYI